MKKLLRLFVFSLLISSSLNAQKVYFIYLQTDNQQPFYARLGEKVYNSSLGGYLILSNLRDSTYSVNIGIQGGQSPDQLYSLTVNKKDQGFLIKNFGEKEWGLFNLNTMAVTMPTSNTINPLQAVKTEKREDNPFTNLLAKATDDSTIKEKPVIVKAEEKKTEPPPVIQEKKEELRSEIKETNPPKQEEIKIEVPPVEKKAEPKIDSLVKEIRNPDTSTTGDIKEPSIVTVKNETKELTKHDSAIVVKPVSEINPEEYKRSVVKLKSESSTTMGIGLVFLDILSDKKTDTINIFIPAGAKKADPVETKVEEKKFLDILPADSVQKDVIKTPNVKSNNCNLVANEDDFFKLRKKMASETSDDNMITEAKKLFRTKCFSTQQVKNLSTLFLTDEFKYKFFDAAYQYVSDLENFSSLQSELKDEYFINRFKAMLR